MSRIKRLVRPEPHASNWKAAIPAIALAAATLVGCAQTAVAAQGTGASTDTTHAIADFASCKKPEYPKLALSNRVTGTVSLSFLVGTDGAVRDSKVKKSSGDATLDEAARLAIQKCRFSPAKAGGKPVEDWVPVQYVWAM